MRSGSKKFGKQPKKKNKLGLIRSRSKHLKVLIVFYAFEMVCSKFHTVVLILMEKKLNASMILHISVCFFVLCSRMSNTESRIESES